MSRKIQVVLPDPVATQLAEFAANAGEPISTLAGRLVRQGVAEGAQDGKVRRHRQAPVVVKGENGGRARWLEPWGGDAGWSSEMWGAIIALHARYPRALAGLKNEWWTDDAHTEMLCALAVWRADIDDAGVNPSEELAFQGQLVDYARTLRGEGGGVTKAWQPGAPPVEWGR